MNYRCGFSVPIIPKVGIRKGGGRQYKKIEAQEYQDIRGSQSQNRANKSYTFVPSHPPKYCPWTTTLYDRTIKTHVTPMITVR